jgi:hypothetical protein
MGMGAYAFAQVYIGDLNILIANRKNTDADLGVPGSIQVCPIFCQLLTTARCWP